MYPDAESTLRVERRQSGVLPGDIEVHEMNKNFFGLIFRTLLVAAPFALIGCGGGTDTPVEPEQAAPASEEAQTTAVTDENYGLAESEVIFSDYVKRIAATTNSNGVGVFMHTKIGADPKDRTVMRINFDTVYHITLTALIFAGAIQWSYFSCFFLDRG